MRQNESKRENIFLAHDLLFSHATCQPSESNYQAKPLTLGVILESNRDLCR